ncbi:MAG TPA: hypothetical protein VK470_13035, partial [Bacteroidota bacterium]|nr:hypothetical protein [Bacteroidota bacterium]
MTPGAKKVQRIKNLRISVKLFLSFLFFACIIGAIGIVATENLSQLANAESVSSNLQSEAGSARRLLI